MEKKDEPTRRRRITKRQIHRFWSVSVCHWWRFETRKMVMTVEKKEFHLWHSNLLICLSFISALEIQNCDIATNIAKTETKGARLVRVRCCSRLGTDLFCWKKKDSILILIIDFTCQKWCEVTRKPSIKFIVYHNQSFRFSSLSSLAVQKVWQGW